MQNPNEAWNKIRGERMLAVGLLQLEFSPSDFPDLFATYEDNPAKLKAALWEMMQVVILSMVKDRAPAPEELAALLYPTTARVLFETYQVLVGKAEEIQEKGGTA